MPDLQKLLSQLHNQLAEQLLSRIEGGEATSADLSVARQFLKDNGVDTVPSAGSPTGKLAAVLPFDEDDPIEAKG